MVVLPGFLAGDMSTRPLRFVLRQLGHRPVGWGLGPNLGPDERTLGGVLEVLKAQNEKAGGPVPILGWSLGGVYGRLVAQEHPDLVEQVISLGSPFNIGAVEPTLLTPIWDFLEEQRGFVRDRDNVDLDLLPVPSTAIYTKTDGVVGWRSCMQSPDHHSENIEVRGSHCGLGFNIGALFASADRLAQRPGDWQPFEPDRLAARFFPKVD